jgi:hypothetical protein
MDRDLEKLARQGLEDFNRSGREAMRRSTAPDYVYEETGTDSRADGVDALIEMCKTGKGATSDPTGRADADRRGRRHRRHGDPLAWDPRRLR